MYAEQLGKPTLSDDDKKLIERMLACPDARPGQWDLTLDAWLLRISLWGKIKITHNNPDAKIRNASMPYDQLVDYADDQRRNAEYGKFSIENPKINSVRFVRSFNSQESGEMVTEEIIVEIDLSEEQKARLEKAKEESDVTAESSDSERTDADAGNPTPVAGSGKKYQHKKVLTYEEAVAWLVSEARSSDRLVALANRYAESDSFHKFKKFFIPKSFSEEEEEEMNALDSDFCDRVSNSKSWEWIDVVRGAFLALGDKANAKKVDDAVAAEFGRR